MSRYKGPTLDDPPEHLVARHLTKEQFGQRVRKLLIRKGWSQSELGRRAGLARDRISTYAGGRSMPSRENLEKIAKAFDVEPEELLPNIAEDDLTRGTPSIDLRVSDTDPSRAWLRVNRMVPTRVASRIIDILSEPEAQVFADETPDAS